MFKMNGGAQIHKVIKKDPLGLGAVCLDIGVWAHAVDDEPPPGVQSDVFVFYNQDEDKWYWAGVACSVENTESCCEFSGVDMDENEDDYDMDENEDDYDNDGNDYEDLDWWKK
jgi:hypothetical protein